MTADALAEYIAAAPSPYHAVAITAKRLIDEGFAPCGHDDDLGAIPRGVMTRGGALVAWNRADDTETLGFRIIGAHSDSPNLRVKPQPESDTPGGRRLLLAPYGGILANSWLDRDLGLAGRVAVEVDGRVDLRLMATDGPVLKVPQLAIHLDREISTNGLQLDPQEHLHGLFGFDEWGVESFAGWCADELGVAADAVGAWDLMTFDVQPPARVGPNGELLSAARLDNLCSCFGGVEALRSCDPAPGVAAVLAIFDHEEVGSVSSTGAAAPLLAQVLGRLSERSSRSDGALAESSRFLSADMAHATHPNYPDRHDAHHPISLDGGPVVKVHPNQRYATDARGAAEFHGVCRAHGIPTQTYAHRADMACGSTIGPTTAARLGIDTIDVGMAQLGMHSARETMAADAVPTMVTAFGAWLSTPVPPPRS